MLHAINEYKRRKDLGKSLYASRVLHGINEYKKRKDLGKTIYISRVFLPGKLNGKMFLEIKLLTKVLK